MASNPTGILRGVLLAAVLSVASLSPALAVDTNGAAPDRAAAAAPESLQPDFMATTPQGDVAAAESQAGPTGRVYRSEVERVWAQTEGGMTGRGSRARVMAMSLGIENVDSAARALIADSNDENGLPNAMLATRLAPDLPVAHMALARVMWSEGDRKGAFDEVVAGVVSIFRNFEALAWLVGSLLVMVAVVLTIAPLLFIAAVAFNFYARASHDLGDMFTKVMPGFARAALLGSLLLVPLALGEGIMGLVLALFTIGFMYGESKHRIALCMAVTLFMVGLFPVAHTAGTALLALDSDPVAAATLAVIQGVESDADIALLEQASESEFLARHVLAVRERRLGNLDAALVRYEELLESSPRNAEILNDYANLRFMSGDDEGAIDLYQRSAAIIESARLMFNLSQANARLFRIEEFEASLRAAQVLDADAVADLSRIGDANFVADLGFPFSLLRSRLVASAREQATPKVAIAFLMPGWLGQSWLNMIGCFVLIAVVSVVARSKFEQASACTRCGRRICARCDGTVWNSETCDGCYHLFHRSKNTDAVLRMTRLYELKARDTRIGRVADAASVLIPGAAGILARRPDLAFLGILSWGFAGVFFLWRDGVVPDPLAVGAAGSLAFVVMGSLSVVAYLVVIGRGLMLRRNL